MIQTRCMLTLEAALLPTAAAVVAVAVAGMVARAGGLTYDQIILADQPVAFWDVSAMDSTEPDLTGNGNIGTYVNGLPALLSMPNGDPAADFNSLTLSNCGIDISQCQYLSIPSNPDGSMSIPATSSGLPAMLTWEAWISPDTLQFNHPATTAGDVRYMGKCERYSPTCEWEARIYNRDTDRSNRMSAYAYNPTAGFGSGAFWQPVDGLLQPAQWLHIVAEYTLLSQPAICQNSSTYPGSIDIWVNGVMWNQARHGQTGCMSQYMVAPQANNSPINIGTMARDSWFQGAIAKVAIYKYLLNQDQINSHYTAMTGQSPSGSCGVTCTF